MAISLKNRMFSENEFSREEIKKFGFRVLKFLELLEMSYCNRPSFTQKIEMVVLRNIVNDPFL